MRGNLFRLASLLITNTAIAMVAITNATLIDGTGAQPLAAATILIQGEHIVDAGTHVAVPKGASIYDATGKYIIPGLIDLHCHYGGDAEQMKSLFALQLTFGVTTARSLGADTPENVKLMHAANRGEVRAPRLYTAGQGFSAPGGLPPGVPMINRPTSQAEAREMVQELSKQDVHLVKMWVDATLDGSLARGPLPKISQEIRTAIVQEATRLGIPAVAHIYDEEDVRQLNAVGVRHFVHTIRSASVDEDFVRWAKMQGLTFAPALSKAQDSWYFAENPTALEDQGLVRAFGEARIKRLSSRETRDRMLSNPESKQLRQVYAYEQEFVNKMQKGGVTVALGSDSGAGNVAFGWGTHHEMTLLVEAGLSPLQAIVAATSNAAFVLEGDKATFGTIEPNKSADLIVLDANPTIEIQNSRKITRVMQSGTWLE